MRPLPHSTCLLHPCTFVLHGLDARVRVLIRRPMASDRGTKRGLPSPASPASAPTPKRHAAAAEALGNQCAVMGQLSINGVLTNVGRGRRVAVGTTTFTASRDGQALVLTATTTSNDLGDVRDAENADSRRRCGLSKPRALPSRVNSRSSGPRCARPLPRVRTRQGW